MSCAPDVLLAAVVSTLAAAFPAVPTVDEYPRLRKKIAVPALLVELADGTEGDDPGTEELALTVRLECRVVFDRAPVAAPPDPDAEPGAPVRPTDPDLEALKLAAAVALAVKRAGRFGQLVGPAKSLRFEPDHFRPDLAGYAVWLVEWSHDLRLGESVWDGEGIVPSEVWAGIAPEIGVPNEPDYELVTDV